MFSRTTRNLEIPTAGHSEKIPQAIQQSSTTDNARNKPRSIEPSYMTNQSKQIWNSFFSIIRIKIFTRKYRIKSALRKRERIDNLMNDKYP